MSTNTFAHLHLHTTFSILDGACRINDLMDAVAAAHMPAVAMTDHGVLYGAIDFYKAARERGVKPILGCEAYITTGSRFDRKTEGGQSRTHHLVLLAENNIGYANLSRLISLAHIEGFYYKPRIDKEILAKYSEGLIGMSACLKGEVTSLLVDGNVDGAVKAAGTYADIFGHNNFYLEVHDHGINEQRMANQYIKEVARRTGLPLVGSNDVHYLKKDHAAAHDVLLCMQTASLLNDPKRMRYSSKEFYLKEYDEMAHIFRDYPGALDRTLEIAERCNVEMEFGKPHFPTYKLPEGASQYQYLIDQGHAGVRRRYGLPDPLHPRDAREREVMDRFKMEMDIIQRTGFVNYFLVVWDFVKYARDQGIPVGPGRGSGGGSLVAYVLGITAIDPLRYGLIFERFLNPERVSPPDFDIDFCQTRRGEVIEYVKQKYGRENVAQIITFGSLGAKTVIRDVGRVLEIPYAACDRLAKLIPDDPKMTLKKALLESPEFKTAYENEPDCKRILDYAFVLEGLYRNPGTHAAGVVIGEKPLIEIIPMALDKDDQPVTQFAMEPLNEIGLLKMDFLGLRTLTVIDDTLKLVQRFHAKTIDLDNLPLDDRPAYDLLNRGDTVGVFQLESNGMRDLIRRVGINNIEDLTAMIALYRPGPMNMLNDYVERKSGKAPIVYQHPLLEPILKETYAVMIYQEQVQKAANVLAGYSLGEADILRRAMGKKKQEVMDKERDHFVDGCKAKNNIPPAQAGEIFDSIAKFAGYGFNKSHSAAYAIISYQTAFLKANFPAEFMAALITSEMGNFDKMPVFIAEASAMNLKILPPDVNASGVRFLPEAQAIRYGLAGIKNVGVGASEHIVRAREVDGPYQSLIDLVSRLDSQQVNKKTLESLVRCGALDSLGVHRARLFAGIDFSMSRAARNLSDRQAGQRSLFDLLDAGQPEPLADNLPEVAPWSESQLLACEKELLGCYLSGHPLTQHATLLKSYALTTTETLPDMEERTLTRVAGIATSVVKRMTKAEQPRAMAILQIEDMAGTVEVLCFPDTYAEYGEALAQDQPLLICGEVSRRNDTTNLIAQEIYPLQDAPRLFCSRIGLHQPSATLTRESLDRIRQLLSLHPGPVPVTLTLLFPAGEKITTAMDKSLHVNADPTLIRALELELGEKNVFVKVNPTPCLKKRPERATRFSRPNGSSNGGGGYHGGGRGD